MDFMFYSDMRECGKSEQNLASCDYLLVVNLVVKRGGLLLRIIFHNPHNQIAYFQHSLQTVWNCHQFHIHQSSYDIHYSYIL